MHVDQPEGKEDNRAAAGARDTKGRAGHENVEKWWLSESSEDEQDSMAEVEPQPDPFYDPDADDADEAWMAKARLSKASDAILSCPGCFTTVCVECQRHEFNATQYRAIMTTNCNIKQDETMSVEVQQPGKAGRKRARTGKHHQQQEPNQETLHPVCCAVCGTQVGAQDADEVVHFFHVLASNA
jgi:hypothetical protein